VTEASVPAFIARLERFGSLGSTQDVVRGWLREGVPEVCLAVADTQSEGRGRLERRWQAPPGRALLLSAGFRPADLAVGHAWRLPAVVCLAMCAAIRDVLAAHPVGLAVKWPNDIVLVEGDGLRKLAGLLAEAVPHRDRMATVIVGIGVNVDWPAADYPHDLAASMGSLSEVAGHAVDREALLGAWMRELGTRYEALLEGHFDSAAWAAVQVTTGAEVELETGAGPIRGTAAGIDDETGALVVHVSGEPIARVISHGDVRRCRLRPSSPTP
jgi:BirA family biotin operon repressor/biotin-[acetyl-CoA-carboxylase] ligase